eukprot:m.105612 g.105612  ORF g.105612 m.105612 type:complete len:842 (+) comp13884_c0_seq3:508-3033(+)
MEPGNTSTPLGLQSNFNTYLDVVNDESIQKCLEDTRKLVRAMRDPLYQLMVASQKNLNVELSSERSMGQFDDIGRVVSSADKLQQLTDKALKLCNSFINPSRNSQGPSVDVCELVEDCAELLATRPNKQIVDHVEIFTLLRVPEFQFFAQADAISVSKVVLALASTAISLSGKGKITLIAEVSEVRKDDEPTQSECLLLRILTSSNKASYESLNDIFLDPVLQEIRAKPSSSSLKANLHHLVPIVAGFGGNVGASTAADNQAEFWLTLPLATKESNMLRDWLDVSPSTSDAAGISRRRMSASKSRISKVTDVSASEVVEDDSASAATPQPDIPEVSTPVARSPRKDSSNPELPALKIPLLQVDNGSDVCRQKGDDLLTPTVRDTSSTPVAISLGGPAPVIAPFKFFSGNETKDEVANTTNGIKPSVANNSTASKGVVITNGPPPAMPVFSLGLNKGKASESSKDTTTNKGELSIPLTPRELNHGWANNQHKINARLSLTNLLDPDESSKELVMRRVTVPVSAQFQQKIQRHRLDRHRALVVCPRPGCAEILCEYLERWFIHCDSAPNFQIGASKIRQTNEKLSAEKKKLRPVTLVIADIDGSLEDNKRRVPDSMLSRNIRFVFLYSEKWVNDVGGVNFKPWFSLAQYYTLLKKPFRRKALWEAMPGVRNREQSEDPENLSAFSWLASGATTIAGPLSEDVVADETKKKVLLVEDDRINVAVAKSFLDAGGYEVDVASNGLEALNIVKEMLTESGGVLSKWKYCAVLMDCQMPVMDGFESTRRIREAESKFPANTKIPIIAMTGFATKEEISKCHDAGMSAHLAKPFDREQLNTALATHALT